MMKYKFQANGVLLFSLESAEEYDTATPYRYAVSRFVDLAERLKNGQSISVRSVAKEGHQVDIQTVDQLMNWVAVHFSGFDQHI